MFFYWINPTINLTILMSVTVIGASTTGPNLCFWTRLCLTSDQSWIGDQTELNKKTKFGCCKMRNKKEIEKNCPIFWPWAHLHKSTCVLSIFCKTRIWLNWPNTNRLSRLPIITKSLKSFIIKRSSVVMIFKKLKDIKGCYCLEKGNERSQYVKLMADFFRRAQFNRYPRSL